MIVNEKNIKTILKNHNSLIIKIVYWDHMNITSINLNPNIFINLEVLSLKSNYIKDLYFINDFYNLYYLDISDNPIDNYNVINQKNVFGYLSLSEDNNLITKFNKLKKLTICMLNIENKTEDDSYNKFIFNNPRKIQ